MLVLNNNGNEEKEFDDIDERMNTNPRLCIRPMAGGCHSLEAVVLLIRVATRTLSSVHFETLILFTCSIYLFIKETDTCTRVDKWIGPPRIRPVCISPHW